MTRLVGVVTGPTMDDVLLQIKKSKDLADLFEIRLDCLDNQALKNLGKIPRDKPLIFTLRKKEDGGQCELEEEKRLRLLEKCFAIKPEYCDIEASTTPEFFEKIKKEFPQIHIISSIHFLGQMPLDLEGVLAKIMRPQAASYKIAVMAQTVEEVLHLMHFAKHRENVTCIAMGEMGFMTRILSPLLESEFCYASIDDQPKGMIDIATLTNVYRFRSIRPDWKIYALLGDPVTRSIGHIFHNESFPDGAVYIKLHVAIPDLPQFFSLMRQWPFCGFSITMPLKERLEPFLTRFDPASAAIGSVNTVLVQDEHLIGYNTDGMGALNALERHMPVKGKQILLLGAGGSARAIACEAIERGAKVTCLNRTIERANALASDFHCKAAPLDEFSKMDYDILINTIPVDLIYDSKDLQQKAAVMDIVYWESETPLLRAARERGCLCIGGKEMFFEQAKLQQKIWFQ